MTCGPTCGCLAPSADAARCCACAVIDGLADPMAVLDAGAGIIAVNQAWRDVAAANRQPGGAAPAADIGLNYLAVCAAAGAAAAADGLRAVLAGGLPRFALEYDCHGGGVQRWFRMVATPLAHGWGGAVVVHHDITAQRQAEADLRVAAVAIDSFEGMMVTDAGGTILRVNRGFTRITGYGAAEAVGQRPSLLSSGRHDAGFYRQLWAELTRDGHWQGEIWNRRKSGDIYPEYLSIAAVADAQGTVGHYVAVLTDITQRKADNEAIRALAFYDPLTQLPNRRLLLERLRQQLRGAERRAHRGALLFIDLDNFKSLNDQLGHQAGDLLLQQVAQRLLAGVRDADTVARLGGDEFVVLCDGLDAANAASQATALGEKLLAALNQPYLLGSHVCRSTPSIGVTLFGGAGPEAGELLAQADAAMYQAKRAGRNRVRFFDQAMQDAIDLHRRRVQLLHGAVALQQFELHYQLQTGGDGRPRGAAALLHWRHADGRREAASEFIGLAEEAGLLAALGDWLLDQVCAQLRAWRGTPLLGELVLTVPVDAGLWRQPEFCARLSAAVARHDVAATRLRLALPAALAFALDDAGLACARALAATGVGFALRDFGAGPLSLRQLLNLPLEQLTIAAALVDGLGDDTGAATVRASVALAHALALEVVADGVATPAQQASLAALGCDVYQGAWHSPPLPLAAFEALALRPAAIPAVSSLTDQKGLSC
jgi:diguanylate cyclase (GGDEF)-like protein/PAS domain S-box-containing protein